jgi:Tyrosine phosphatase family
MFYCTAGKDRTGWLAAIILTALGVDERTVVADYLMTNTCFTTGRGAAGRQRLHGELHCGGQGNLQSETARSNIFLAKPSCSTGSSVSRAAAATAGWCAPTT